MSVRGIASLATDSLANASGQYAPLLALRAQFIERSAGASRLNLADR
jgi:hypothetical protein